MTTLTGSKPSTGATLNLFEPTGSPRQHAIREAERILLDLADHIYAHTSLKPISKALFLISRCLFVISSEPDTASAHVLCRNYTAIRSHLGAAAPEDDFSLEALVNECGEHINPLLLNLHKVHALTQGTDSLGLVFNTLLRGKFEGGEGLGTFLTPEEVVNPMVDMLVQTLGQKAPSKLARERNQLFFGDVCGGTGRFVYAMVRRLIKAGLQKSVLESSARLFDQSRMAVDFAKLNFLFDHLTPHFRCVGDSLIAPEVSTMRGQFLLLATNPPFGVGKYKWSPQLAHTIPPQILELLGMNSRDDATDPSELFLFRNLDLLAKGGALAIVLPDGIVQSNRFREKLCRYEELSCSTLTITALVSLPVQTFSLGGTVAKTSFLLVRKDGRPPKNRSLYVASPSHVGFLKRGNRRLPDPSGNELTRVAAEFLGPTPELGCTVAEWRQHARLVPSLLAHGHASSPVDGRRRTIGDLAEALRVSYAPTTEHETPRYHISVLDIDETGLIDILKTTQNKPTTAPLACRPGDVLISCINPRIWRVAVIPNLSGFWSCSPEFLVLRPRQESDAAALALCLHHPVAADAVQALAGGTSSSRQRVPKERVLAVEVPHVSCGGSLDKLSRSRLAWYRNRLAEGCAFEKLHRGARVFSLNGRPHTNEQRPRSSTAGS